MNKPLVLPAAGLAAMQRGNGHCNMESSFLYSRTRRGYINSRPCPRVLPTTQRARGEIFKLSLAASIPAEMPRRECFKAYPFVARAAQAATWHGPSLFFRGMPVGFASLCLCGKGLLRLCLVAWVQVGRILLVPSSHGPRPGAGFARIQVTVMQGPRGMGSGESGRHK